MTDADLNRAIAERVMGWTGYKTIGLGMPAIQTPCAINPSLGGYAPIPDYADDPRAVFGPDSVVERMAAQAWKLELSVASTAMARFDYLPRSLWPGKAQGPNICRAVCLAAVQAVAELEKSNA